MLDSSNVNGLRQVSPLTPTNWTAMSKFEGFLSSSSSQAIVAKGDIVTIPDAHLLFTAQFSREGHDLVLTGEDGKSLVVVGYFNGSEHAALASPDGALLTSSVVSALAGPVAPSQYVQAGDQQPAAGIGKVVTLEGSVTAQHSNGIEVQLAVGDPVALGDVLQTQSGSSVGVVFIDGTVFSLSASSRMVLDNLVYQPGGSDNALTFNVVQGTFSFVAGQVAPTGDMKIETPVATMGIRGTTPGGVCANGGPCNFFIFHDPGTDHVGAYLLTGRNGESLGTVRSVDVQYRVGSDGVVNVEQIDPSYQQIIDKLIEAFERRGAEFEDEHDQNGHKTRGSGIHRHASVVNIDGLRHGDEGQASTEGVLTPSLYSEIETVGLGTTRILNPEEPPTFGGDGTSNTIEDVGISTSGILVVSNGSGFEPQTIVGTYGTFTIDSAGNWTYTLNNDSPVVQELPGGAEELDSFDVTAADGSASTTVVITVVGTNDVAVIGGVKTGAIDEDGEPTISGTLTVSDVDSGEAAFVPLTGILGAHGTFAITSAGVWTYTVDNTDPAVQALTSNQSLTEVFDVQSVDGSTAQVIVTIDGVNDAPVAVADTLSATEDTPVTYTAAQLLGNDTDSDSPHSSLFIASVTSGVGGTAVLNADGSVTFTPAANFNGAASFTYTVSDGTTTSVAAATVSVNVAAVNESPNANDDSLPVQFVLHVDNHRDPIAIDSGQLLANDTDLDGDLLTIVSVSSQSDRGAELSLNSDGTIVYNPPAAFNALHAGKTLTDSFTYTVSDGHGGLSTATVSLTITAVDEASPGFTTMALVEASPTGSDPSVDIAAGVYSENSLAPSRHELDSNRRLLGNATEFAVLSAAMMAPDTFASFVSALPVLQQKYEEYSGTESNVHRDGVADNPNSNPDTSLTKFVSACDSYVPEETHQSALMADVIQLPIPTLSENLDFEELKNALKNVYRDVAPSPVFEKPGEERTSIHHADITTATEGGAKAELQPYDFNSAQGLDLPSIIDHSLIPNLDSIAENLHISEGALSSRLPLLDEILDLGGDLLAGRGFELSGSKNDSAHPKPSSDAVSATADHGHHASDSASHCENQTFSHVSAHDLIHSIANDMQAVAHSS